MDTTTLVLLVAPIAALDLALKIWALVVLARADRVRWNKLAWVVIILFVNMIGAVAFLLAGREDA